MGRADEEVETTTAVLHHFQTIGVVFNDVTLFKVVAACTVLSIPSYHSNINISISKVVNYDTFCTKSVTFK